MKLDFLEIGTSDFDTLIESANDDTIGISIEPLKYYLDKLPNKKNVIKLNCAVSFDDKEHEEYIYYIPEDIIRKHRLPYLWRGCNSIGDYHYWHKKKNATQYCIKEKIRMIPLSKIIEQYNITSIDLLKIDTEGMDCKILQSFHKSVLLNKSQSLWPKKIHFESNYLTPDETIVSTIKLFERSGYKSDRRKKDTTLML